VLNLASMLTKFIGPPSGDAIYEKRPHASGISDNYIHFQTHSCNLWLQGLVPWGSAPHWSCGMGYDLYGRVRRHREGHGKPHMISRVKIIKCSFVNNFTLLAKMLDFVFFPGNTILYLGFSCFVQSFHNFSTSPLTRTDGTILAKQ
jgi:hypothetical protein